MKDNRTVAIEAMQRADSDRSKIGPAPHEYEMQYNLAVAQVRATLWLGEMLADLTSAVRETGHK